MILYRQRFQSVTQTVGMKLNSVTEGCTNIGVDAINKQDANGQKDQKTANKPINYFFSSNNTDANKRKSSKNDAENTQQIW